MLVLNAPGIRVVARPEALDAAVWHESGFPGVEDEYGHPMVFRFAPDEAFGIVGYDGSVDVNDPDAIVFVESGFLSIGFEANELRELVLPHIEWTIPNTARGNLQGAIASVPAKLSIDTGGDAWVLVARAYADELMDRLGIARLPVPPDSAEL